MTDEELFAAVEDERIVNGGEHDEYDGVLTAEERIQLDSALLTGYSEGFGRMRNMWLSIPKKMILKKFSKLAPESCNQKPVDCQKSPEFPREDLGDVKKGKQKSNKKKNKSAATSEPKQENEYKKGLRPVLWFTPGFPLETEELLPLLDILANKVKAVRRLRELLTTKLPPGTFPVQLGLWNMGKNHRLP
ncbi:hypothetical protein NE237_032075 [Protea cynaroides]|uniref:Ankyrin repeat domain-containing protein n=1 Tax=Protea cynaroides TaxID=273540 RepID=A0A9Q0R2S1_9MAGN|nr:hypothetical protein NE237_032075 [Protea cynaroides]